MAKNASPENRIQIGQTLRALRKSQHLSVNALAAKAGVSMGIISQIERDLANPSIKTLEKLSAALTVPVNAFLDIFPGDMTHAASPKTSEASAELEAMFIRRKDQRPTFSVGPAPLHKALLSPAGAEDVRFMLIKMPPQSRTADVVIAAGQKAGLIMEGSATLQVGEHYFELFEGDSFQFDGNQSHGLHNASDIEASILWIMSSVRTIHM